jgi:hypothetical protein
MRTCFIPQIRLPGTRQRLAGLIVLAAAAAIAAGPGPQAAPLDDVKSTVAHPADDRYLTHVSTDKPIYRSGETVYVRAVTLNALTRTPLKSPVMGTMEIVGPKGEIITTGYANFEDSVAGFSWTVPDGQAGGEYTVRRAGVPAPAAEVADRLPA